MNDATGLQSALMNRFDFDAEDLACNRAGEYSERQLAALQSKRAILPWGSAVAVVAGLGIGWIAATSHARDTADFRASRDLPRLSNDWGQGLLGFALVTGFLMAVVVLLWWRLYYQQLSNGPKVKSGPVKFGAGYVGRTRVPAMVFGNGVVGSRHVVVGREDEALIARIGQADVYWKQGSGRTDVLSIDVTTEVT